MIDFAARNLCKNYDPDIQALADVTWDWPAGSFTLLTGPSGSGKTTLLALLGALERPSRGQVLAAGRDLTRCSGAELTRFRRRLGFVFQDFALIPGLLLWENVTAQRVACGESGWRRRERAKRWLDQVGLGDRLRSMPDELSSGEQQRAALARALAGDPDAILADEPTSHLDKSAAANVIALLKQSHSAGRTIVVASHDDRLLDANNGDILLLEKVECPHF